MTLTDELKQQAENLGFCAVGITSADRFHEAEGAASERTAAGLMDGLSWWSDARVHASADPRRATPEAQSVIALAFPHPLPSPLMAESNFPSSSRAGKADDSDFPSPSAGGQGGVPRGRIAGYALGRDY